MFIQKIRLITGLGLLLIASVMSAQVETDCNPTANLPITQGEVIFNYGSATNAFSFRNRSSYTVAQPFVGISLSQQFNSQTGFWARFLLPPQAPAVMVSQGDFPDRVLIKWTLDPLSSSASNGYVILRDGAFLAQTDAGIVQFIDFNVQAGEFYEYSVYGRNQFGNGARGRAVGFVNPNGIVTGKLETFSGNPVVNAHVRLTPTIGKSLSFDGVDDYLCVTHLPVVPTDMWTVSAWVKIGNGYDSDGIIDLGSDLNKNFWLHTTPSGQGKGVVAGVGHGSGASTITHVFAVQPDGWHQVAAVYAGGSLLLYVDGKYVSSARAAIVSEPALFTIGSQRDQTHTFHGNIDDVRLYNAPLTSTTIFLSKDLTVSRNAAHLVAYWKFDEGLGVKAFDLSNNKMHAYIRGATFSNDAAPVNNAGFTDESGFYAIEGVNYSQAQTFTATPVKNFYSYYALEFNAAYGAYATLTDFDLPDDATVEIALLPFDLTSRQSILSKGHNQFELWIEAGDLKLSLNGETQVLGPITSTYQHISLTLEGSTGLVSYYHNGNLVQTLSYASVTGTWTGSPWQLASRNTMATDFYTGLIDEVAFYGAILDLAAIQLNASPLLTGGTDVGNPLLLSHFSLDEGSGTGLFDYGPQMSGEGVLHQATFSIITYRQKTDPNLFLPSQRIININTSNTATSGVDFINNSTIPISGVVRFENTFCYQEGVEILVNGQSYFPRIFTDVHGRFVADFEPGVTVTLRPVYDTHVFSPGFFQIRRLNRPIAGVLFQNQTKRQIKGQIAGGKCRLSVIPDGAQVKIKAQALNDCYSQVITLDNADGNFLFTGLPPIPMALSVVEHSNNIIYDYFQIQGGKETDLRLKARDTIDFIYIAPPNVWIQPFDENGCAGTELKMIEQSSPNNAYRKYRNNIRVYETYDGGDCYLDSFRLIINNQVADASQYSIWVDTSTFPLEYWAGIPNITGDYTKLLQVTVDVNGSLATALERVVVLGERSRESTFTTASPAIPLIILRDPPGDGSSATLASGTSHCQSWSNAKILNTGTSAGLNLDLGAKVVTYAGTPFGGVITEAESINEVDITASFNTSISTTESAEVCVTNDIEYSTSDGDAILFGDADLYVGAAVNFEFSATDVLGFDPETCEFTFGNNVRVWPEGFGTKYVYSGWQIETSVIPSLELIGDTTSANSWRDILAYNRKLKNQAIFRENLSFDALTTYTQTQSTTRSSTSEFAFEFEWEAAYNQTLGFEIMDVGSKVSFGFSMGGGSANTQSSTVTTSRSTSFTLADDDPNDKFTIDILDDPIFGTPVFRLKSGETMCPWEPGTLNREEVGFSINRLTAVNVPENDAAVFRLTLSNIGQTGNDAMVYTIGMKEGSNPEGASLVADGSGLPLSFQLQPFQSIEVLLAVFRGPEAYSYNDIGVYIASECQLEHSRAVGYDLAGYINSPNTPRQGQYNAQSLSKFYKEFLLDIEFLEPCSPIDIGFPQQDWVMTPSNGDIQFITLNSYEYDDPDLELVRVQYRRTGGDGSWINIVELPASAFADAPVFKIVPWDMTELVDGPYEIRAITQCFDVSLNPGISRIIQGRKETRPPALFGSPQPADGILSPGDEISIQFSKRIRCDRIFQADGIGTNINVNNLALIDLTEGGILVDATISCNNDKIIIVPNTPNRFIENHTLKAVVDGIEDLYGNATGRIEWEFFVNRSSLNWVGGPIEEVVLEGNERMVTREIRNQGGSSISFTLDNIPDWMDVFPRSGTLAPGGMVTVNFIFPANLVNGNFNVVVNMLTVEGTEPLPVNLRVACPSPDWSFNPAGFSFSMNLTLQLDIEGEQSTDRLDKIGAFVHGELRGLGMVQYSAPLDKFLVFLTVYSDVAAGETVNFQIWDASACSLYGTTIESFPFEADGLIGAPLNPQVIRTNNMLLRKIYIHPGWNWISYNVELPDPSVTTALSSLTNPSGGLIKGQTAFSSYFSAGNIWLGSLSQLSHLTMFQYKSNAYDSLLMIGMPVNVSTPIPVVSGWNWLGYLPQRGLPVNQALASLTPLNGDIIKGQFTFAQFVAGIGWIGNLNFMSSPNGYLLRISNPGTLVYPQASGNNLTDSGNQGVFRLADEPLDLNYTLADVIREDELPFNHWQVNPQDYEFSMNLIAIVASGGNHNFLQDGDEVGAFVGNQVRGSGKTIYIAALDAYMVFVTIYANQEGELLNFRLFDASANEERLLQETFGFQINSIRGTVENPQVLSLPSPTAITEPGAAIDQLILYPNPATDKVYLQFFTATPEDVQVILTDALGRELDSFTWSSTRGANLLEWRPRKGLSSGMYVISIRKNSGLLSQKLQLIR
jgi:hypothetical protein